MSEKKYQAPSGFKCTLSQLVKIEPEWACNRIREGEKAISENKNLKDIDELRAALLVKFQEENKALKEKNKSLTDGIHSFNNAQS